jgi:hypothetical protein
VILRTPLPPQLGQVSPWSVSACAINLLSLLEPVWCDFHHLIPKGSLSLEVFRGPGSQGLQAPFQPSEIQLLP